MSKTKSQLQADIAKFETLINKDTTSEGQKKVFRAIQAKAQAKLDAMDKPSEPKAEVKKEAPKKAAPKRKAVAKKEEPKKATPKKKTVAKKKTTKKKTVKKKTTAKKTTAKKSSNRGSFAALRSAIAKRDGISYKAALPIAKKEYAEQKKSITKAKVKKSSSRLDAYKRKYKGRGLEPVNGRALSIEKDAKQQALPRGKRISKGTGANQYGKAKKGKVYYEYRSNRTDIRQPKKGQTLKPPRLARGGNVMDWLFIGKYPTGTQYADKTKERNGYYKEIAYVFDEPQEDWNGAKYTKYRLKIYSNDEKYQPLIKRLQEEYGTGVNYRAWVKNGSKMAKGGMTDINEDASNLPKELRDLFLDNYDDDRYGDYQYMEELRGKANQIGYDFDYDLSGTPTAFTKTMAKGGKTNEWNWTEKEVRDGANNLAKALNIVDGVIFKVHDFEYDKGRGAGFELSMDGNKYEGGSYYVEADGTMVNAAIANSTSKTDYGNIKDSKEKLVKHLNSISFAQGGILKSEDHGTAYKLDGDTLMYAPLMDSGKYSNDDWAEVDFNRIDVDLANAIKKETESLYAQGGNVKNNDEAYVRMNKGYVATIRKYEDLVNHPNLNDDLKNIEIVNMNEGSSDKFKNQVTDFVSDIIVKTPPRYVEIFLNHANRDVYIYCSHPNGVFGTYEMPNGREFDIFIPYISKGSRELNVEKYKAKSAFTKSMKKYIEENCTTIAKGGMGSFDEQRDLI